MLSNASEFISYLEELMNSLMTGFWLNALVYVILLVCAVYIGMFLYNGKSNIAALFSSVHPDIPGKVKTYSLSASLIIGMCIFYVGGTYFEIRKEIINEELCRRFDVSGYDRIQLKHIPNDLKSRYEAVVKEFNVKCVEDVGYIKTIKPILEKKKAKKKK